MIDRFPHANSSVNYVLPSVPQVLYQNGRDSGVKRRLAFVCFVDSLLLTPKVFLLLAVISSSF